eukprot:10062910-Alexandrium_andersonii.AAC.1
MVGPGGRVLELSLASPAEAVARGLVPQVAFDELGAAGPPGAGAPAADAAAGPLPGPAPAAPAPLAAVEPATEPALQPEAPL